MTFRLLLAGDSALLREMTYQAIFVPPGFEPPPRSLLDEPEIRRYTEGWGARPGDLGLVALADGEPVGAAWMRLFSAGEPGYGFVDGATPELSVALQAEFRGAGIGTRLLRALLDEARARGVAAVSLSVQDANPARRLYERLGFVPVRDDGEMAVMRLTL